MGGLAIGAKGIGMATGLAAMGLGIGGFIAGLAAGDTLIDKFDLGDGSKLKGVVKNIGESISYLDAKSIAVMGALIGASALGVGGFKQAKNLSFLGLGIGGFFVGLSAGDTLVDAANLGDGSNLVPLAKNFTEMLGVMDGKVIAAMAALIGISSLPGIGQAVAVGSVVGLPAIGLGISGFFGALAAGDWLVGKLGDGSNMKKLMINSAEGIEKLVSISGEKIASFVSGLDGLPTALLKLLGANGLASIAGSIKGLFKDEGDDDIFDKISKSLRKLESVDVGKLSNIDSIGDSVLKLADGFDRLNNVDFDDTRDQLEEFAKTIAWAIPLMNIMYKGGTIGSKIGDGYSEMDFGVGLQNTPIAEIGNKAQGISRLAMTPVPQKGVQLGEQTREMEENKNRPAPIVVSAPTSTTNVSNSTSPISISSPSSATDSFDQGTR